jgi:hypothetical protein
MRAERGRIRPQCFRQPLSPDRTSELVDQFGKVPLTFGWVLDEVHLMFDRPGFTNYAVADAGPFNGEVTGARQWSNRGISI